MSNDPSMQETTRTMQAAEAMPRDLFMIKMEGEAMMAAAVAHPREPVKIVKQLQELVDAYPAAADDAIYVKPVGSVYLVTCKDCNIEYETARVTNDVACPACDSKAKAGQRKVQKFAEGLSIRAAEAIRSIYGFTRLATTTEMLDDGRAKVTGSLTDYAAGNVTSDERIVSQYYRARDGRMTLIPEDRFLNVVVKAEKAKLRRDVILDNTPNIVKAAFRDACENRLKMLVSPEEVAQKIIPAFGQYDITKEHLEAIIGRTAKQGWTEEDRLQLRKMLSALKNGETSKAELLQDLDVDSRTRSSTPPSSSGPVTADALAGESPPVQDSKPAEDETARDGEVEVEDPTAQQSETDMVAESMKQYSARIREARERMLAATTLKTVKQIVDSYREECPDEVNMVISGWGDKRIAQLRRARSGKGDPDSKQGELLS